MSDLIRCPAPDASLAELDDFGVSYNAYERIANSPKRLLQVVRPVIRALDVGQPVPMWAGVDLLRAALFYVQRRGHFTGLSPELDRAFRLLIARIHDLVDGAALPRDAPM